MSIVEKIEGAVESGVKAVEKFFTGEGEAVKSDVEGEGGTVEQAVEGEAGNVAKAVESENTQAAATGATAEAAADGGFDGQAPAA